MNCSQCEQLVDAYLDGELSGGLRVEFDAHRLRCRHCQQMLAMIETAGHVISANHGIPELSDDFADRVMKRVDVRRGRILRLPQVRIAAGVAMALQAAAVLVFAVMWRAPALDDPTAVKTIGADAADVDLTAVRTPAEEDAYLAVVDGIENRLWEMHQAGQQLSTDLEGLARYLDIAVPNEVAAHTEQVARMNPWQFFWGTLLPAEEEEPAPAVTSDGLHTI
jgi:anti-sigma factor RsiW